MNIIILAAGKGTRMKSTLPKVMQCLAGRPMLSFVLETARSLDPQSLIVVYGYGKDQVLAHYADQTGICWVEQRQQLGTGDAVRQGMSEIKDSGSVMVLYGDVPCILPETLNKMAALANDQRLILLTATLDDPTGYGRIVRDDSGRVIKIVEQKDATESQKRISEINTGILLAPNDRLKGWLSKLTNDNVQGEYYLTDIVEMAVADEVEVVTVHPKYRFEIEGANHFGQLELLERTYQRYLAENLMSDGVRLADAGRIDIRGQLICGTDVFIDVGCVFEGKVNLGNNVSVGPNCVLKNVTIADNTAIDAFCHLEASTVGEGAKIGPYARLRPGAALKNDVHIGNFVEIKNAVVGNHSKINHLSYIGDADIGKRVNIGAGTITCNYDGTNKYRTVIEDDVFVGSDTQLVAPVKVKEGATIGAGTTLTKEAPANKLTVSRARQMTIDNWQRPKKSK